MLTDLSTALAQQGWDVTVLTSRQQIENPLAQLPQHGTHGAVKIQRLYSSTFGRARLFGRAMDYLSFYFSAGWALLRLLRRGDVVIAKTDPPLISIVAAVAVALKGARLVNWLQDVYPEVAVRLGVFSDKSLLTRILTSLRNWSLRRACANVVVGARMRDFVQQQAPRCGPIYVIHNWSRDLQSTPAPTDDNPYRRDLGLHNKVVFSYSGNLGRAHQFDHLVAAARQIDKQLPIHFLIIGSGAQAEALQQEVRRLGLDNWSFLPPQPRELLEQSLGAADVHLVSLNPAMEGLIVPSKIYGILAAARPSVFMGAASGEISNILRQFSCGTVARTESIAELAQAIRDFALSPEKRFSYGERARQAFSNAFAPELAIGHWARLLEKIRHEK